mmetsp:Transcript_11857/g.18196  ORF Transcript_11857/g.18196 Transcript_11857/m.18196 type:complete len:282 (+) Transcript_11857:206-1051(+)
MKRPLTDNEESNFDKATFPYRLHRLLDQATELKLDDIISWHPSGSKFVIHKQADFVKKILPNTFNQTKFASFRRQINAYKFEREISSEKTESTTLVYSHPNFHRDNPQGCERIVRKRANSTQDSYRNPFVSSTKAFPYTSCMGQTENLTLQDSKSNLSWGMVRPNAKVAFSEEQTSEQPFQEFIRARAFSDPTPNPISFEEPIDRFVSDHVLDELVASTIHDDLLDDERCVTADLISWDPSLESLDSANFPLNPASKTSLSQFLEMHNVNTGREVSSPSSL